MLKILEEFNDKDTSIALSSTYTKYSHSQYIKSNNFSIDQFNYLISDECVKTKITELPLMKNNTDILVNTPERQKVKWFFENKQNISKETYGFFFTHIVGNNNDDSSARGRTIDDIARILKFVNPFLNLIPDKKLTTEPQILYDLIVNDRQVLKSQYANSNTFTNSQYYNSQYYTSSNFIDECINADKYIQEIVDFVVNIYRISNDKIDVTKEIGKLLKHTSALDKKFIELINKNYTLSSILNLIFDDDENYKSKHNFEDNDRLILLQHCLNQKSGNEYLITEDKAKKKMDELLTFAQNQKSAKVFDLLESLITQERYKIILSDLIIEKNCDFISSLPQKFLKLAIGTFKKDNCNDFANNFDFLKVIIQYGSNFQKELIVKVIITKLDNNQDIEKLIKLIDLMKNVPEYDPDKLLTTHLKSYLRGNQDSLVEELKKVLEKQVKNIEKEYK